MTTARPTDALEILDRDDLVLTSRPLTLDAENGIESDDDRVTALRLKGEPDGPLFDVVTGGSGDDILIGTAGDDTLSGLDGDDTLSGGAGNDLLDGGSGSDTADYSTAASGVVVRLNLGMAPTDGDGGSDTLISIENVTGSDFNDLLVGTSGANILIGGLGRDYLLGLGGNDILIGGAGIPNQLQGGLGDDDYYVSAMDALVEFADEGYDRVFTDLSRWTLRANLEELIYTGSGSFTGIGNSGDNTLRGGSGRDYLLGFDGNDILIGGAGTPNQLQGGRGDDDYYVSANDTLVEFADEGHDRVFTDLGRWRLGANFEALIYTGSGSFTGIGNSGDNTLRGGSGRDYLLGFDGNDILIGGAGTPNQLQGGRGDDDYYVSANDTLVEFADEGYDRVLTDRGRFVLGANVEALIYTGSADFIGIGNNSDNTLIGGSGNDRLSGGLGRDVLIGGAGDDVLIGGDGLANQLQGGLGDDTYVVSANDTLVELANEGHDTVVTTLNRYTLRANFEDLTFVGDGDFVGFGNDADNLIIGSNGNDTLRGGKGDDVLVGSYSGGTGGGFDTAVLSGLLADYVFEDLGGGTFRVTDQVADRDGIDLLFDIDQVRFSDGSFLALVPGSGAGLGEPGAQEPQVMPDVSEDGTLPGKAFDLPLVLPGVDELDPAVIDFDLADQPVQVFDHMITLDDDGFLMDQTDDGFVLAGLDLVGATVEAPPVMPALDDDDFLVSKDSDVPQVFPGIDEFDPAAVGFELADQPVQLFDHMMTIDDDGFLLGPTDDLGRLHDHDGWLF
jgi:Ca2+-binding RTX toxin-like protein